MKDPTKRWWDFWSTVILLVILTIVTSRLVSTNWTQHLHSIQLLTILAAGLGLLLGLSRFSSVIVISLAFSYGAFTIPCSLGIVLIDKGEWLVRLDSLATRLRVAISLFSQKSPVNDPILFLFLMAILFWSVGIFAGYQLTRSASIWKMIFPAGLVLLVINHYDRYSDNGLGYIGLFIFLTLILLGRLAFLQNQAKWQKDGTLYSPETRGDISRATFLLVASLVLIAWFVPIGSTQSHEISGFWAQNIMQPWDQFSSRIRNAFTSLQSRASLSQDPFSDTLTLSRGSHHQDTILFTVKADQTLPPGARYYWRVRTYNTYSNGQWTTSDAQIKSYTPSTYDIQYTDYSDRKVIEFTFTTLFNLQNLPAPSMPIWIDDSVKAIEVSSSNGTQDVLGLIADPTLSTGEVYHVRSLINVPTVADLQATSTNYPGDIADRYLTIPANLEPRLKQLALQITADSATPYDKANAITLWLRNNITYQETISTTIPEGEDPILWFLFDSRQGFCDYYASAEVLLLRSIGIPARISAGYVAGTYEASTNSYLIRQSDAHAWPEVYFPEMGWIEFEPTVSQPDRSLPAGDQGTNLNQPTSIAGNTNQYGNTPSSANLNSDTTLLSPETKNPSLLIIVLAILAGLIMVGLGYTILHRKRFGSFDTPLPVRIEENLLTHGLPVPYLIQRWSQWVLLTPFEQTFRTLNQTLHFLKKPVPSNQTPAERTQSLIEALPEVSRPANIFLEEYQKAEYSAHQADLTKAKKASGDIRFLVFKTFVKRLFTFE